MITREISPAVLTMKEKMPVVVITGPRQSGKTTLAKALFPTYEYINLEFPDVRAKVSADPRFFLTGYEGEGVILDEVQRVPELFSYIQGLVDESSAPGRYILTGSHNFLLMEKISQSLAGRAALFNLLPLTITEIMSAYPVDDDFTRLAFQGTYPRLYDQGLKPPEWYPSYIDAYVERDVRQVENVRDLNKFYAFLQLCAARVGQLFNASALANELGVSYKTVLSWISILEASFVIFLLPPYYKNFNKRIIKSPKLYFYDTGLVCSLLGIQSARDLALHYLKGEIFESLVISEIKKRLTNAANPARLYFWRDRGGHEIDCLIDFGARVKAVEIKSGTTITPDFFKNLEYWQKVSESAREHLYLVYGGAENQRWPVARVIGWKKIQEILGF
ncbi:MAG: ATP-binding protein [Calditrichaeota bacterium]|nr:MAG: ATP-binding protein [Calditrichota bacterium]